MRRGFFFSKTPNHFDSLPCIPSLEQSQGGRKSLQVQRSVLPGELAAGGTRTRIALAKETRGARRFTTISLQSAILGLVEWIQSSSYPSETK